MRKISEIAEHSVYRPGMTGWVLDAGANKAKFGQVITTSFPVSVMFLEANPDLARPLEAQGFRVAECALGRKDGIIQFNIATNDEASSIRLPLSTGAHLRVKHSIQVKMKSLLSIMKEEGIARFSCVKLDIEGAEIEVLMSLASMANKISPQWTVEFHDADDLKLCTRTEVDEALRSMKNDGFSVLVRNWPNRTNVLFLDRVALSISLLEWAGLKFRYQYFAAVWRQWLAIRQRMRRAKLITLIHKG